jgi:hypothetical protein
MATKDSGDLDGDATKAAGALEKNPTSDTTADSEYADSAGYDYSDGDGGGGAYVPPSDSGGGSGGGASVDDAGTGEDGEPADPEDPADAGEDDGAGDDSSPGDDSTPGDDTTGDDSTGGDLPLEGAETLPAAPPVDDVPRDPGPSEPPRPHQVSIDIELMRVLIAAMERARDQIPELEHELRSILRDLDLEPSIVVGLDRVTEWIDAEVPGMRQRLALAEAIEDGTALPKEPQRPVPTPRPRPGGPAVPPPPRPPVDIETLPDRRPVIWDEDRFVICPPHEAADHGRRAAGLLAEGSVEDPAQAAELIRAHGHDPYFAREFASNTDPSFIAEAITAAESEGTGPDLRAAVTATITTAARATGELAMDDATRDAWAAALT